MTPPGVTLLAAVVVGALLVAPLSVSRRDRPLGSRGMTWRAGWDAEARARLLAHA